MVAESGAQGASARSALGSGRGHAEAGDQQRAGERGRERLDVSVCTDASHDDRGRLTAHATPRRPAVAVKTDVRTGHDIAYVTRGHASGCAGAMAYYTRTGDPPGTWEGRGCTTT